MIKRYNNLSQNDIGRKVTYQDFGRVQEGEITSWNDRFIFAKFKGPQGEACNSEDLTFSCKEPSR